MSQNVKTQNKQNYYNIVNNLIAVFKVAKLLITYREMREQYVVYLHPSPKGLR